MTSSWYTQRPHAAFVSSCAVCAMLIVAVSGRPGLAQRHYIHAGASYNARDYDVSDFNDSGPFYVANVDAFSSSSDWCADSFAAPFSVFANVTKPWPTVSVSYPAADAHFQNAEIQFADTEELRSLISSETNGIDLYLNFNATAFNKSGSASMLGAGDAWVSVSVTASGTNTLVGNFVRNSITGEGGSGFFSQMTGYGGHASIAVPFRISPMEGITLAMVTGRVEAWANGSYGFSRASLQLADPPITLPDGTSLASLGVKYSFSPMPTSSPIETNLTSLVSRGANWRYFDEGVDLGPGWRLPEFDDSSWSAGPAELGYGDGIEGRPEATVVSFGNDGANKHPTTYFRHAFTLEDPASINSMVLELLRDDGAAVFLNGVELVRDRLANNATHATPGMLPQVSDSLDETRFYRYSVDASALRSGQNILAVEIHQATPDSADLSFDLALFGANHHPQPVRVCPTTQVSPVLPCSSAGGRSTFCSVPTRSWIDPPLAEAFEYAIKSDSLFSQIVDFPTGFDGRFAVWVEGLQLPGTYGPGEGVVFSNYSSILGSLLVADSADPTVSGVRRFTVSRIAPHVDSADHLGFPLQVAFTTSAADLEMIANRFDFDADGTVGRSDVALMARHFGTTSGASAGDTNSDGRVSLEDVVNLQRHLTTGSSKSMLLSRSSSWRYLDDGSNQGVAWREMSFDDGNWDAGDAELGYGDTPEGRPEATVVNCGPSAPVCNSDNYYTTYFRRDFDVQNASDIELLWVRLMRDDGAIVYVNGVRVVASNVSPGELSFDSPSGGFGVSAADESKYFEFEVNPSMLVNGRNVVAVEVHQATQSSSDISFDLEIEALLRHGSLSPSAAIQVPEPSTACLSALALATLFVCRVRRRQ